MELVKVKSGLLEAENFFLASSFSDFAGSANIVRDVKTGKLKLISNNKIERSFNYNEFVIEVEKENFNTMNDYDYSIIYIGNDKYTFGIRDRELNEQNKYWKILKKDNYIQAYTSKDGKEYVNIGGLEFDESITKQGFEKHSNENFTLNKYRVYSSSYVTLQNAPEGSILELYSINNQLVFTDEFNDNMECNIFLDSITEGYFIFKDVEGKEFYRSGRVSLSYGDIYVLSPYNFEITYYGNVVTNTNPTLLKNLEELVSIKNIGNKEYKNIKIGVETSSNDLIQLSFDGENYFNTAIIDNIKQSESKDIFIRITKNIESRNSNIRDFQLVISE